MNRNKTLEILNLHKPDDEVDLYDFISTLEGKQSAMCVELIQDALGGNLDAVKLIIDIQNGEEETPEVQKQLKKYENKLSKKRGKR